MSDITIPTATTDGAAPLMALAIEAFAHSLERYGHTPPGLDSLAWHKEQIQSGFCHSIMYGNTMVGGIYLLSHPEQVMQIDFFFVGKQYQGKRIGSTVMQSIEAAYPDVKKWVLNTPYKDFSNHAFYEKRGYVKVGEFSPMEGNDFTLFRYEKQLG